MQQQQEIDFTKHLDAGLWRRLIGYMKPYHRHLIAIMVTMGISAHGYRYPMYHALGAAFTLTARCEKDGALLSFVGEAEREKELSPY